MSFEATHERMAQEPEVDLIWPDLRVAARLSEERVVEGDIVDLVVEISSTASIPGSSATALVPV